MVGGWLGSTPPAESIYVQVNIN